MSQSRRRMKVMPSIREESNLATKRIPVHIIPPGTKQLSPIAPGSMIIQTLPDEPEKPPPKVTPSTRSHDNVDQIVADYLHFSRYGKVLPVTQGFAPSSCPCCLDRNRQSMRLLHERHRAPPPPLDPDAILPSVAAATPSPRRSVGFSDVVDVREVSPRRGQRPRGDDDRGFPTSWMDLQPNPQSQVYLNAEFSRPYMRRELESFAEERRHYEDASKEYVSTKILDADTRYELAMRRLERSLHNYEDGSRPNYPS